VTLLSSGALGQALRTLPVASEHRYVGRTKTLSTYNRCIVDLECPRCRHRSTVEVDLYLGETSMMATLELGAPYHRKTAALSKAFLATQATRSAPLVSVTSFAQSRSVRAI